MRAVLAQSWPALSAIYGLHPWDLERLSWLEIEEYQAQAEQWAQWRQPQ